MNRKGKIIVSVVGIFIVLLALIGITYGYFLTRIQGNTNTKSISVTTKNLELVYGDGTQNIITKTNIMPDTVIGTKDFTVTNKGADTSYVVLIDGDGNMNNGITPINVTYITSGTTRNGTPYNAGQSTSFESNDFVYTLTCTSDLGNDCNEQNFETSLPMNGGIILGNNIKEGDVHRYNLTVTYKETNKDQTDDMNKGFNAQINIEDIKRINPYSDKKTSLAYNIINNSILNKNGTELVATPPTKIAEETSSSIYDNTDTMRYLRERTNATNYYIVYACDYTINENGRFTLGTSECPKIGPIQYTNSAEMVEELKGKYAVWKTTTSITTNNIYTLYKISDIESDFEETKFKYATVKRSVSTEKIIAPTQDDYGTSYYYRGGVENNYVTFAKMCWRIVRIEGDGSTKLILEDQNEPCSMSIDGNWNIPVSNTENARITALFGSSTLNNMNMFNYLNKDDKVKSKDTLGIALKNFQINKLENYLDVLKSGSWCFSDNAYESNITDITTAIPLTEQQKLTKYETKSAFNYETYIRIYSSNHKQPTLKCKGIKMDVWGDNVTPMYVGPLTADETLYAGFDVAQTSDPTVYLFNDFQREKELVWWLFTPSFFSGGDDYAFLINTNGTMYDAQINIYASIRPSISLKPGISIADGGEGTLENPYVIES